MSFKPVSPKFDLPEFVLELNTDESEPQPINEDHGRSIYRASTPQVTKGNNYIVTEIFTANVTDVIKEKGVRIAEIKPLIKC